MSENLYVNELKEIQIIVNNWEIQNNNLQKELESLINSKDVIVLLLYSRRALEVIITEICEKILNRERGTEPLRSIIDRLLRDKVIPEYIHTSMQNLNSISTYGAHPKEFDPRQVRSAINELITVLEWYFKQENYKKKEKAQEKKSIIKEKAEIKVELAKQEEKEKIQETEQLADSKVNKHYSKYIVFSLLTVVVIVIVILGIKYFLTPLVKNSSKSSLKKEVIQINETNVGSPKIDSAKTKSNISPKKDTTILAKVDIKKKEENIKKKKDVNTIETTQEYSKKEMPLNQSTKKESLETILSEINNKSESFAARKLKAKNLLNSFEKNAIVSIYMNEKIVDRMSAEDYINRLLIISGIKIDILRTEKSKNDKYTILEVSEKKMN